MLERDSAGYVLTVSCGEKRMEGERFRQLFRLASSCFFVREESGRIYLQNERESATGWALTVSGGSCWRGRASVAGDLGSFLKGWKLRRDKPVFADFCRSCKNLHFVV